MRWAALIRAGCPLWVISGHRPADQGCPLCPRKQTCSASKSMLLCAKRRHRSGFENCACKRWLTVCKIPLADLTERVTVEREHFRSCLRPPCRSHPHSAGRAALISTKSHCSARRCWLPPSSKSRLLWRGSPPGGRDSVISQRHSETRCETGNACLRSASHCTQSDTASIHRGRGARVAVHRPN